MSITQKDYYSALVKELNSINQKQQNETLPVQLVKMEESFNLNNDIKPAIMNAGSIEDGNYFGNLTASLEALNKKDIDYTELDDSITAGRKIRYGMAQEPTIIGNLFRLGKAGFQSAFSDETFEQASRRIEKERQEEIFLRFPEFKGKREDLTVLSGRMGVAVADPVTFFIPWAKFAKLGALGYTAAGAGLSAADIALREKTLYGDVNIGNVAISAVLGGASTGLGLVISNKLRGGPKKETLTINEDGKAVVTPFKNTDPEFVGPLPQNIQDALNEVAKDSYSISVPFIENFRDNLNTLGVKFRDRDAYTLKLREQKKKLNTLKNKSKEEQLELQFEDGAPGNIKQLENDITNTKKIIEKIQEEINEIALITQPKNIAINGFNSFITAYKRGLLEGEVGENLTRALVHEMVRPLVGATAGGAVNLYYTDGAGSDSSLLYSMGVGAALGIFSKRLENYKPGIPVALKKVVEDESEKIFKNSYRTYFRQLLAGTHAANLQGGNEVIRKFGTDLFGNRGNAFDFGEELVESVEESKNVISDFYRRVVFQITSNADDATVLSAGRIVQQHNMPSSSKYTFLEEGDLDNKDAVEMAKKFLEFQTSFKEYAKSTGIVFNELDSYGLTQILDTSMVKEKGLREAEKIIKQAFKIQNLNEIKKDPSVKPLSDERLGKIAYYYLNNSDNIRRSEIVGQQNIEDDLLNLLDSQGLPISNKPDFKNKTLMQSAQFFDNKRVLYDQEARAYAKELFIQDPEFTNLRLIENTIPVTEFSRRFGPTGSGVSDVFKDLRKFYSQFGDLERNSSLQKLLSDDMKTIKDSINAYFRTYGASSVASMSDATKSTVLTLQAVLSATKLYKVALPSLGDLLQVMNNSGFKSALNSFILQIQRQGVKAFKPSTMLAQRRKGDETGKFLNEDIMGRKFANRRYNGTLEKELYDYTLAATTPYQNKIIDLQRYFFEIVQLGRVTRFAREFAYDAGAFRAFDLGVLASKNKLKRARIRELNSLGLNENTAKYLGKFNSMDEAYADPTGKFLLDRAGRKAADRDALIPQVGNRRLFSQTRNPFYKFLGSFLSWAQAKTTQTNSLIRRIEDGDGKLALMMLTTLPLYGTVKYIQNALNPSTEFREEYANPLKSEEDLKRFIGETAIFSGQLLPFYVDKAVNFAKYNENNAVESLYPVASLFNDFSTGVLDVARGKPGSAGIKLVETVVPFAKELTRRDSVGEFLGFDDSIIGSIRRLERDKEAVPRPRFVKGGVAEVPFTKEDPADRKNPFTNQTYSGKTLEDLFREEESDRLGFQKGTPEKIYSDDYNFQTQEGFVTYKYADGSQFDIYDEPSVKEVAPVIELLVGGVPKVIAGLGKAGFDLIENLSKQSTKINKPMNYYHGSTQQLDKLIPAADRVNNKAIKDLYQAGTYLGKPNQRGFRIASMYAKDKGFVNVVDEKQFNQIAGNLFNPRNIPEDIMEKFAGAVANRQQAIKLATTQKEKAKIRKEIIDLENLFKPSTSGYISRINTRQRDFLQKLGYDGVDVSDDVVVAFNTLNVKKAVDNKFLSKLRRRQEKQEGF